MISIVIPTYNHLEDCLVPCIESILKYTNLKDVEIIISANGCTDGTYDYVKKLGNPFRIVYSPEQLGFAQAVNDGISAASGEFIVLLNNDTVLLEQSQNEWLNMLMEPFKDKKVGITGPLMEYSEPADKWFLIFFCTMIRREVFDKVGMLDSIFREGGGEDTDFCFKAEKKGWKLVQVPSTERLERKGDSMCGGFPMYHSGEATVGELENWEEIFERNSNILRDRYNRRWKLGNNYERAVIGINDPVPPREHARYQWALENVLGKKVLEIGCSSGYGYRYFSQIAGIDYLGIDKDREVVEYAKENFGEHFKAVDINRFDFGQYDTIVAFEVLEHLDNGVEIAQKLKEHCRRLLITVPFKEPPGLWGEHHKLHNLSDEDFPGFDFKFLDFRGKISDSPAPEDAINSNINLLLGKWDSDTVTAVVSTKDRYYSTLPMCLTAIANQTLKPEKLLIFDDGEQIDLRSNELYKNLFAFLNKRGIAWEVHFGERKGQVANHQKSIEMSTSKWIWRIDDDNVPERDVLEKLVSATNDNVGAVGGLVLDPKFVSQKPKLASNKIEDIYMGLNEQWYLQPKGIKSVDHLYSTFIYRRSAAAHGYSKNLSPVGHREETMFTYEMKKNGWKLLIQPDAVTWHFREGTGGIRSYKQHELWESDEQVFTGKLQEWGVEPKSFKMVVLDNGLGDHLVFKKMLPELQKAFERVIIAACYPEVFKNDDVEIISIAEASLMANVEEYNVYKFMVDNKWERPLEEAFKELYG